MKVNLNKWPTRFLCLLLATDFLFIIIHILFRETTWILDQSFSVELDRGYPEVFQYVKEYWIVLLFLFLAINKRVWTYLVWSFLFLYLLMDDYFKIHEDWGHYVCTELKIPSMFYLRPLDFGELIVSSCVGVTFVVLLSLSYYFSSPEARRVTRVMIGLLSLLAFFGIFIDMLHIVFRTLFPNERLDNFMGLLEDGGEHIVMSVIAWYVFLVSETQIQDAHDHIGTVSSLPLKTSPGEYDS